MKLHTDPIRQARQDTAPPPAAIDRRPMHRGGRRVPGLRRLQPYRVTLICRLWRTLCPRAARPHLACAPNAARCTTLDKALRDILQHIARHVVRRIGRAAATVVPRRSQRRPARPSGRGGSWWQAYSPCDGIPAAARDGTGR